MPTAVQTNSAMTMIPPEKFKTVQQHTKMLSRIQPTDTKTGERRYEGYGNYGTDYRSQHHVPNDNASMAAVTEIVIEATTTITRVAADLPIPTITVVAVLLLHSSEC